MSEKCIKTGADVYLEEYGCVVHGDLFVTGSGTYVFNASYPSDWKSVAQWHGTDTTSEGCDIVVERIAFERRGVFVFDALDVTQSPSFTAFRAKWG
jgi:hypothetical protein